MLWQTWEGSWRLTLHAAATFAAGRLDYLAADSWKRDEEPYRRRR